MQERPRPRDIARTLGVLARTAAHVGWERLAIRETTRPDEVPPRIEAATPAWLTHALCRDHPDARVEGVSLGPGSNGTSVRRQLQLRYNAAGTAAGLPPTVFAKSTPTVVTRMANGATGVCFAEAGFYREIRPCLTLPAPRGFHSAVDPRSLRSLHLLEDLVATSQATFCSPLTEISRQQAEQIVTTLADLHGTPSVRPFLDHPPTWLGTYPTWWRRGISTASIRRYHRRGFTEAAEVIPPELRDKGDVIWQIFLATVREHDRLPRQLIHGDVHLGNWYIDGEGAMGLCDWQCVSIGHGTRDLAYAVSTVLCVEDRRAWEHDLIELYVDRLRAAGGEPLPIAETWDRYRRELTGALLMWTPTHSPPPMFPAMQPRDTSREMIRRITTAMADHGVGTSP